MAEAVSRPPFPFFLGCGRSGTTLVRVMFGAHPQMAIPPGTRLVRQWADARGEYERPEGFDTVRFESDILSSEWLEFWDRGPEVVRDALSGPAPADVPDAIRRVYAAFAASQGKTRYGNKSHGYVIVIPSIAALLPEARFVHIVRDGRNVALSLLEAPFGPDSLDRAARFWSRRVEKGRADGRRLGPARYHEVRYEDLVEDPESQLRPLCAFLELPYDDAMLHYYERDAGISRGLKNPEIHRNLARPPTTNVRDWREQMSPRDVAAFEAIAGGALDAFGYERSRDVPLAFRSRPRSRPLWQRVPRRIARALTTPKRAG